MSKDNLPQEDWQASWEARGYAPLRFNGAEIDLVKQRLLQRAQALGFVAEDDPDVHVLADGKPIYPIRFDGTSADFLLPTAISELRLMSRSGVPCHHDPANPDRRHLGVALTDIIVEDGPGVRRDIPLDHPLLGEGFYEFEWGDTSWWRWTDGSALLPSALWNKTEDQFWLHIKLMNAQRSWRIREK
jgi:hypothetical protein